MTAATTKQKNVTVGRLTAAWSVDEGPGRFRATGIGAVGTIRAIVRAFEPLDPNPDYLLRRFGADTVGPLGRPRVQSLPEELADGISVVAFEEAPDGALWARIDLVRRAWERDIVVSARTSEMEVVDALFSAMLDLLAIVKPIGDDQ
jgi:hypothetical protein